MSTVATPGHAASLDPASVLYRWLGELRTRLRAGERPEMVTGPFGTHRVTYGELIGEAFCVVGFCLPDDVFAEIDGGTYGQMQGFRIFLGEDIEPGVGA